MEIGWWIGIGAWLLCFASTASSVSCTVSCMQQPKQWSCEKQQRMLLLSAAASAWAAMIPTRGPRIHRTRPLASIIHALGRVGGPLRTPRKTCQERQWSVVSLVVLLYCQSSLFFGNTSGCFILALLLTYYGLLHPFKNISIFRIGYIFRLYENIIKLVIN